MLEGQWSEALAAKNIRTIICWVEKQTAEGDVDLKDILSAFSCWVQRTSELTEKELFTLCFSHCQGLWMFLDRSSFVKLNTLLQRLQNLLTLVQWAGEQLCPHFSHDEGVPYRDVWNRQLRTLKQHIWLGRLVQWWGIMGLLPKSPEAHELKRISQMWKEMELSYQRTFLKTPGLNPSFLIEGMLMQLGRKHGCIWTSAGGTDRCYPPPNLQALLKLVLVPHADNLSIQTIFMYFILDVANFLQCKDDLLQSFCHAFMIPSNISQQIRAFWMFDCGHIKASMELFLSPRASPPHLSWQHRCIVRSLLANKHPHMALKYYQWTRPAIETIEDAKLYADVLLQSRRISEAWALLKRGQTGSDDMAVYFLQACEEFNLHSEASKYITEENDGEEYCSRVDATVLQLQKKVCFAELPPSPLSSKLYQNHTVTSEELVKLVKKAVIEVRKQHPKRREVVWPRQENRRSRSHEIFLSHHLPPSPLPKDIMEETEETVKADDHEEEKYSTYKQPDTQEDASFCENLSSVSASSFTSASSLPPLKHPHVYESTLTLQRISSLLTDQEIQSGEEEEEEDGNNSSTESSPCCLELTPDGATDLISLSTLETLIGLIGAEGKIHPRVKGEDEDDEVLPEEDSSDADPGSGQKGCEHHQQEEPLGCCSQDLLTDFTQRLVSEESTPTSLPRMDCRTSSCLRGHSHSRTDFTAKQREDKQPPRWIGKTSPQGATRSRRTQSRKSKRAKIT